jgi:uncharacterized radical SAM superfamily protein
MTDTRIVDSVLDRDHIKDVRKALRWVNSYLRANRLDVSAEATVAAATIIAVQQRQIDEHQATIDVMRSQQEERYTDGYEQGLLDATGRLV